MLGGNDQTRGSQLDILNGENLSTDRVEEVLRTDLIEVLVYGKSLGREEEGEVGRVNVSYLIKIKRTEVPVSCRDSDDYVVEEFPFRTSGGAKGSGSKPYLFTILFGCTS